jgi:hypothetical protein
MREKYGRSLEEIFDDSKYQLMHIELFCHHIIHAECLGGDIDLLLGERCLIGCFPWRFVDGESCICRIVAFVDDDRHAELMKRKEALPKTRFGDVAGIDPARRHEEVHARARAARKNERTRRETIAFAAGPQEAPRRGDGNKGKKDKDGKRKKNKKNKKHKT